MNSTNDGAWRHSQVPPSAAGQVVEMYSRIDADRWFHAQGTVILLDGEAGMDPTECTLMEFADAPGAPTEGHMLWRYRDL